MNYCNCPNCRTDNCPNAVDAEAQRGAAVRSSELVRDREPRYSKMELDRAVTACCTCGGGGPGEKHTCPACEMYHALVTVSNESKLSDRRWKENMNDTKNNLQPATPETAKDSAGSLERLVRLLSFYHEWKLGEFTLRHVSGLELWHCNGLLFLYVREPETLHFTLLEKLRLWPHVKRCMWRANKDRLQRLGRILDEA